MSGITLSSSVRQNLLSLQSTADLLSTTQSRLSTGNKVNSALDNPTNFFTAQSLNNRASDINNLLDGIGNGVQILQAANTGITSLQKLVDSAKSLANQALQTPTGYSTKSSVSTTVTGATADNLLGTTAYSNTSAASNVIFDGTSGGTTGVSLTDTLGGTAAAKVGTAITTLDTPADATGTAGAGLTITSGTTSAAATGTTLISALTNGAAGVVNGPAAGDQLTVDGKTITFTASGTAAADSNGNYTIGIDQSIDTLLDTVDTINGNTGKTSAVTGGAIVLSSGTNRKLEVSDNTGGTVLAKLGLSAANANTVAIGGAATTNASITTSTKLFNTVGGLSTTAISDGTTLTVSGKTITFKAEAPPAASSLSNGAGVSGNLVTDGKGNSTIYIGASSTYTSATVGDVLNAIDLASGTKTASVTGGTASLSTSSGQTASSITSGAVTVNSSSGADLSITGAADFLKSFGLTTATGAGNATVTATRTTSGTSVGSLVADGSSLNVNGKTITFKNAPTPTASSSHQGVSGNLETDGQGNSTVYLQKGTVDDVLKAIDLATGVRTAALGVSGATIATTSGTTNSSLSATGALKFSTGIASDLSITGQGNALSALGLTGSTGTDTTFTASRTAADGGINGKSLTFDSFQGGAAVNVTFGDGTNGTVKTLAQLNTSLNANNLTATVDATGKLTISATNDYASAKIGAAGGTATTALSFSTPNDPVQDANAQSTRANLVSQYNNVIDQITTTAQDSSFNGVNLLGGDTLKLTFNETGKSNLNIQGVTFNSAGLGLSSLNSGTDFIDNASTNKVLTTLNNASTALRSQASTLGSNLTIVQLRQDFSKSLINVLQTGASNLTLADTNEEAANSQALSTRQSIAVSALSLANQSQQGVLQLLR